MNDESTLLRRFAAQRDERAFAELVGLHLGLVYHSALRVADGDAQLAEDAAQATFSLLAAKAASLVEHPELAGWLYATACLKARELRRGEQRRRHREQTASTMHDLHGEPTNDEAWSRVRPLIDDALLELPPEDRSAVVLRFFEGRGFAEIGAALRVGENAARMRVDRALGRLQGVLAKRGLTSTTTALASALAVPAGWAAPAGLAVKVTGAALAGAAGGGVVATFSLIQLMNTKAMAWAAGLAPAAAVGTAVHYQNALTEARVDNTTLRQELAGMRGQVQELESRLADERSRREAAVTEVGRLRAQVAAGPTSSATDPDAVLTREAVYDRFRQGMALVREGKWEAGLAELLWCYDVGMVRISALTNTRNTALLSRIADLGEQYPPALAALRERRDACENRVLAPNCGQSAVLDYAALNDVLGDGEKTLVVYDTMSAGDVRKDLLGLTLLDEFVAARRYNEVVRQFPDGMFLGQFEAVLAKEPSRTAPGGERMLSREQRVACETAGKHIEALAGAGELAQASALLGKVLAVEDSAPTRARIAQHLARAGHPELLPP